MIIPQQQQVSVTYFVGSDDADLAGWDSQLDEVVEEILHHCAFVPKKCQYGALLIKSGLYLNKLLYKSDYFLRNAML